MPLPWKLATVCLLRRCDKTLFIDYTSHQHPIHEGFYAPPGGKVEEHEDFIQTTQREVREETNIMTKSLVYRGVVRFHNEERTLKGRTFRHNFRVHIYDCHDFNDSFAKANEGGRLVWVDDSEILNLPISAGDNVLWKWLGKYQTVDGAIVHRGEHVVEYRVDGLFLYGRRETIHYP